MSENISEINASEFTKTVIEHPGPVVVDFYSTECPPCEALASKFHWAADRYGNDIRFVKIFRQGNRELAEKLGVRTSPTLIFYNDGKEIGTRLNGAVRRSAMVAELDKLISPERAKQIHDEIEPVTTDVDVLILGAGPAGLTAGIYAAQAKLDTLAVDPALGGGHLAITHQVSNFPGFPTPQPGFMLAHYMVEQAKHAGVQMRLASEVTHVDLKNKTALIDGYELVRAKRIIVATGTSARLLGVKGEKEYAGNGVSYCATCDAKYYEGKHVVVIGGGNSAIEESLFIAKFASKITIVHQFAELQANKEAQRQAFANEKISFLFEHEPREFLKRGAWVDGVEVENLKTHEKSIVDCDGVFIFAGLKPNLDLFEDQFELDNFGYLKVDTDMRTNIPGVFAAGDIGSKKYRQMTTAVSDGTIAAITIARDLA